MSDILVQFVGAGDAFGSGGRFQTCIALSVDNGRRRTLLDCGASSLIAMKRLNIDPVSVDAIILTHLHGDHFGGIPFVVLDAQFARRERPLLIVGPPGTADRVRAAMEIFFPGSVAVQRGFALQFLEIPERTETVVGPFTVTAYAVVHASGAPSYAV